MRRNNFVSAANLSGLVDTPRPATAPAIVGNSNGGDNANAQAIGGNATVIITGCNSCSIVSRLLDSLERLAEQVAQLSQENARLRDATCRGGKMICPALREAGHHTNTTHGGARPQKR